MKRFLSLFIILVLLLSTLASCNLFSKDEGNGDDVEQTVVTTPTTEPTTTPTTPTTPNPPEVTEADIQEAIDQIVDMYEDLNDKSIQNGHILIAQIKIGKTTFAIDWSSDNENVTFTYEDGLCYVNISNDITENANYKLTASVSSPEGQVAETSFNLVLTASFGMITNPVAGTAYKLALLHGNEKCVVYFDGNNYNSYAWYLAYTTDILASVDVYLEEVDGVEGGYRLYFDKDGEKTYIVAFPRDGDTTKGTLKLDTVVPDTYWTYNTELNTLVYTSVTGEQFYIGSSGTYKSISCSSISYINGATNYPCRLYGPGGVEETLPEQVLPELPENPTSQQVVDTLYQLQPGQTIENVSFQITGVVTKINEPYTTEYNNISVWIQVEGREDKPVLLYHAFDQGGVGIENIKVGDTVTASGSILTNYNGKFETGKGTMIKEIIAGTGELPPVEGNDVIVLDMMGSTNIKSYSTTQMVYAANGITLTNDKNTSTTDCYNNTGSYAGRFYTGATIKIEYPGMTKIVITLDDYTPDGTKYYLSGFDGMTVPGATITRDNDVVTIIFDAATDVFQSTALASQTRIEKIEVFTGEVEGGGNSGTDTPITPPAYTAPVAGQPYKFFMELPSGKVYFIGAISGNYLSTSADESQAVSIYFEEVTGGYHIYFMNGETKTYITAAAYLKSNGYAGCHFSLTTETPTLAWTYNTTLGIIEIYDEIEGKSDTFFAGTYGTYNTISLSGAYYKDQISSGTQYPARIELVEGGEVIPPVGGGDEGGETPAPHEHVFVEGKCECGETDPTYVPPVEGGDEVVSGGSADFDTLLPGSKGDSSYTKTHTTTDGWVIANSAIQAGGSNDVNPQFTVVGPDNTHKAVCLNGKTSAPGKLTSPTLTGGISKLTMDYTKIFTDTKLSVTITITDLTTGAVYTHVVERDEAKDTKYVVWTDEWVLDTAIEGDFTIEIVNNCPTAQNSNKDRITILDLSWTK